MKQKKEFRERVSINPKGLQIMPVSPIEMMCRNNHVYENLCTQCGHTPTKKKRF
ncbi:hypothetical protein HY484_03825 [Candidatus Woesearchaeota archaeon]|nr:hypothetical protein [Candidatus Woesearchaeota archaeon]